LGGIRLSLAIPGRVRPVVPNGIERCVLGATPHITDTRRAVSRSRDAGTRPTMIGFLVAGLVIGALARLIKPGKQHLSILATLLLGLVGSVIGGVVANLLGTGGIFELNVLGFIVSVIAAVLLIGVAEGIAGSRRRSVR
jgi:uncharacterized membrane protein YeaQ/YmgE (transglycosylase-associated protein family)